MITERRKNRQKHVVKVINRKDGSRSRGVSEKGKLANEKEHEKYKHLGQSSGNAFVKDTEMVSAEEDKQLEIFGGKLILPNLFALEKYSAPLLIHNLGMLDNENNKIVIYEFVCVLALSTLYVFG